MAIELNPIGTFHTDAAEIPRHWSLSEVTGQIVIEPRYHDGLKDIKTGDKIIVLFHFHKTPPFEPAKLIQTPPHRNQAMGVFSICSPFRPNPIGLSILEIIGVSENTLTIKGADMLDGTPVLDIKPHIEGRHDCPSNPDGR